MNKPPNTALIIGASSGVGRKLAFQLASQGYNLHLVARGGRDLDAIKNHLSLSYNSSISISSLDLAKLSLEDVHSLVDEAHKNLGSIARLFLISGANSSDDSLPIPGATIDQLMSINALGPIHILNRLVQVQKIVQLASVTICSTIASPVPRKKNLAYATAKGALESFAKGCRHYLSSYQIPVQIYRLGYVDTNLSFGQTLLFPAIPPEKIAKVLIKNCDKNSGITYLPCYWTLIVFILKALPWSIYRKLSF